MQVLQIFKIQFTCLINRVSFPHYQNMFVAQLAGKSEQVKVICLCITNWNLLVIINETKIYVAFTLVWLPRVAENEICLPWARVSPRWNNESGSNEISMRLKSCQLLFPSFIPAIPRFPFIPSTFLFSRHSRETLLVRISHSTFWKETVPRCCYRIEVKLGECTTW